jgi:Flp pilus assembly protein TadD
VERLANIYQTAVITQLKVWISRGQHREAVSELSLLTQRWPGEGEVWELLITALYRSDRRAEASKACRRAIDAMREQGLDDSLFQHLQRDMLNGSLPKRGLLAA